MKQIFLQTHFISEYFSIIESQPAGSRHLFRGQADQSWPLLPSLYRTRPNVASDTIEESFDIYEKTGISRFFNEGLPYLPAIKRNSLNDRILAQHFGVPTRMLDWSNDPLVALFFAVENLKHNADSAVFMILPDAHLDIEPERLRNASSYKAIKVVPPAIDRRIPAQKSVLTWHPYGPPDAPFVPIEQRPDMGGEVVTENGLVRGFAKIIIPAQLRVAIRYHLFEMGIDRRNLFPGLDGVGGFIADITSWSD